MCNRSVTCVCVLEAAADIEIQSTDVCAATLHNVFDLDADYKSNLDFSKPGVDKVKAILDMKVLFLDEADRARATCVPDWNVNVCGYPA